MRKFPMPPVEDPMPEPMPEIRPALLSIKDAKSALARSVWNKSQLEDAIRSAEFFIDKAKKSLKI